MLGEIGGGRGHDPGAERGRRLYQPQLAELGQARDDSAERLELGVRLGAAGEVVANGGLLGWLEGPEDKAGREIARLLVSHPRLAHAPSPAMPSARPSSSPTSARRSESSPRRTRLLTVPSGVPVRSA